MTRHATGPGGGKVEIDRRPHFVAFKLVNFDIDDARMKREHVDFIDREILPLLRARTFRRARLTGLTSRTGGFAYDMQLGQRRAENVRSFLFRQLTDTFKALPIDTASAGLTQALGKSDKDGADDRAVLIEVFSAHAPDKPPPIRIPPPPPNPLEPDYIKTDSAGHGTPMFQVPTGKRLIRTNGDNTLSFGAGQIVDCVVSGTGVAHVTISEGQDKRTVVPHRTGTVEEFTRFGKPPLFWNFNFKLSSEFTSGSGTLAVVCYSEWIKGMPRQ